MSIQTIDLIPKRLDLFLYAGDGVRIPLTLTNSTGNPLNLTGSMKAQIRLEHSSPDPPSAEFAADLSDGVNGKVVLTLTGEDTQPLAPGEDKFKGVWDLEWDAVGEEPVTLLQGKVECSPDVSR